MSNNKFPLPVMAEYTSGAFTPLATDSAVVLRADSLAQLLTKIDALSGSSSLMYGYNTTSGQIVKVAVDENGILETKIVIDTLDGVATEDTLEEVRDYVASINNKIRLGQTSNSGSISVILSSDQGALPLSPDAATETTLSELKSTADAINDKIHLGQQTASGSVSVILSSDQTPFSIDIDAIDEPTNPDNVLIVGTDTGLKTGNKFAYVNNKKEQILAAHDKIQNITYADFGTKHQRITQIDYSSPTVNAGNIARKTLSYTLVSGEYRRDSIIWTLI